LHEILLRDKVVPTTSNLAGANMSAEIDKRVPDEPAVSDPIGGQPPRRMARPDPNDTGRAAREAQWRAENKAAIEESNRYFEEHGLPLEHLRVW
jgi:Post-segregation antitoxin CcdA